MMRQVDLATGRRGDGATGRLMVLFVVFSVVGFTGVSFAQAKKTACVACHSNPDMFDDKIVDHFARDVHGQVGLSCHDCHGGNPDPALSEDIGASMDPDFKANPYVGAPEKKVIPQFCGKCHSSPAVMNRFRPGIRVDQEREYWTSHHGKALQRGDEAVAACTDCHGVHGILRVGDPESSVYATKVAETCGRCHSDPKLFAGRKDDFGGPMPTDQAPRWRASVHALAMFEKGDITAPTCNDCHGNHGATPPGIASVAFVCGNCHGREAELFRKTVKHEKFAQHNEMLSPGTVCGDCHDALQGKAPVAHFSECVSCHDNHGIIRPTVAILGVLPTTPCAFCHEPPGQIGNLYPEQEKTAENYQQVRDDLLRVAQVKKLDPSRQFDWLVDQALSLNTHTIPAEDGGATELRPEFRRLFEKFRIGKARYHRRDPVTGQQVETKVRQCTDCHMDPEGIGRTTATRLVQESRELTSLTARAERLLLAAQRGGVEVRTAESELEAAVDSQIELEVLVHTFAPEGAFAQKKAEGVKHAQAALEAGQNSLRELSSRRRGLFIFLGVMVLVLIALAMKIRQLS